MISKENGFCPNCKKAQLIEVQKCNHTAHLIGTLLTGFWVIIWIICAAKGTKKTCTKCGCVL